MLTASALTVKAVANAVITANAPITPVAKKNPNAATVEMTASASTVKAAVNAVTTANVAKTNLAARNKQQN